MNKSEFVGKNSKVAAKIIVGGNLPQYTIERCTASYLYIYIYIYIYVMYDITGLHKTVHEGLLAGDG